MQAALPADSVGNLLTGKRVILASASARRREIFEECLGWSGFEVIPSTFEETLDHKDYEGREIEYPVDTAAQKALEVYEREVKANPAFPPDLVISADTIVLLPSGTPAHADQILEKPGTKKRHMAMLEEQNGETVKVITGVNVVFPTLQNPGYAIKSLSATTSVTFADCPPSLLASYVEHGEGIDRAGGWAIQGIGSVLVKSIQGDFNNVKGFPAHAFYAFMQDLIEKEEFPADE